MNSTTASSPLFFNLRYSAAIRIWHWLTFLLMAGAMITVLFAETVFEEEHEGGGESVRQERVERTDQLTEERPQTATMDPEARAAKKYRHKIWEAHKYIGFGLCFLLLSRVFIETRQGKEGRLLTRINNALKIPVTTKEGKEDKLHFLLAKWGYVVFYALLLVMALTGLVLAFEDVAFLRPLHEPAEEVHSAVQYGMYAYVLFHIIGVIRADMKRQPGIVSAMINGGNE